MVLLTRLQRWLALPPRTQDEPDQRSVILNAVTLLAILGLSIGGILTLLTAPKAVYSVLAYAGLVLMLIVLYGLMRRGHERTVSIMMIAIFWCTTTGISGMLGGVESPITGGYLVLIVLAAMLLGPVGGVAMAGINILTLLVFNALAEAGRLPAHMHMSTGEQASIEISHYILMAGFLYFATSTLRTAHRRTYQALRDLQETTFSKSYVDNILQSMSSLLFVLNPDGTIRTVNRSARKALGFNETELIGKAFSEVAVGDMGDLTITQRHVDQRFRTSDGRLIPVRMSTAIMRNEYRAVVGIVCVAQDVTERLRAEEQVRHQAHLLQNVSDAIIATSMDMIVTSWNQAAEQVYGWTVDDVIGKNLEDVVQTVYGDGEQDKLLKKQYFERGHWRSEVVQHRKDGTPLHILSSVSLLKDSHAQPTGIVYVNHDITQRKQAEIELQKRAHQLATLRSVEAKITSTLDINAVLEQALHEAAALSGADHGFILITDVDGARMIHKYGGYKESIQQEGYGVYGVTARVMQNQTAELVTDVHHDPEYVPDQPDTVALMAIPLISNERALGVLLLETAKENAFTPEVFDFLKLLAARVAAAADNARLYQIAQRQIMEITELYRRVSHLEQLKTDMINIASHDLRSPISLINGYLELIRLDVFERMDDQEKDYVESIAEASRRMLDIVQDILSLERIKQMADNPLSDQVNLNEQVQRAVQMLRHEAAQKSLSLVPDLSQNAVMVRGDAPQLYEVITNLVSNAIKYTPDSGKPIVIRLYEADNHGVLEVQDEGYGIPDDQQDNLFQPFYRAHSDATAEIPGIGLGLYLIKNIIDRHQGQIVFASTYGKGSTFGFRLRSVHEA